MSKNKKNSDPKTGTLSNVKTNHYLATRVMCTTHWFCKDTYVFLLSKKKQRNYF